MTYPPIGIPRPLTRSEQWRNRLHAVKARIGRRRPTMMSRYLGVAIWWLRDARKASTASVRRERMHQFWAHVARAMWR